MASSIVWVARGRGMSSSIGRSCAISGGAAASTPAGSPAATRWTTTALRAAVSKDDIVYLITSDGRLTSYSVDLVNFFIILRDVETRVAVQRAIASSEPAAAGKGIRLEPSFGGARETLQTDPVRLDQILVNLLSNAIRHSPERATIQVAVAATEDRVSFSVIDHGPGVPSELHQKIFEPFERFDPHSGHGTGLGLPVSRGLAEALGGTLVVEGTTGGGATFILKIPSRSL